MIEYGIVEESDYRYFIFLVFKKLFIEYSWYNERAHIVYFKNIKYSNDQGCFIITYSKHREISGVNYNLIFKLDFFNDRMGYEHKITDVALISPGLFKYYIISLKEQV